MVTTTNKPGPFRMWTRESQRLAVAPRGSALDRRLTKQVYAWEHRWWDFNHQGITLREARHWVRWACRRFSVKPPVVRMAEKLSRRHTTFYQEGAIHFQRRHLNVAVALHEAAHHIQDVILPKETAEHGPAWLGCYLLLLATCAHWPKTAIYESAKADGMTWLQPHSTRPRRRSGRT